MGLELTQPVTHSDMLVLSLARWQRVPNHEIEPKLSVQRRALYSYGHCMSKDELYAGGV